MRRTIDTFLPAVSQIQALELKFLAKRPWAVRLADLLVTHFGTARFFFLSLGVTLIWVILNIGWISGFVSFDPYPFILLTMVASVGAIFMTVVILISQNRQAAINTLRNELLLQLILITERELTRALRLLAKRGKGRPDPELTQMLKETNVSAIERILTKQLTNNGV
ncbi:hypothetical protein A2973_04715 [Candidatus Gottesmanbacteria bacterium RIFCSPLOWO2_01_FULL_49_10]|uniref:DUF1003 domain-containing protein n=1 Tax=Candidatus Gottesmanbacteria bacterium RIFCSPLOWO2_01_FULL_49_10 TaxID=1798396 RepID=A0A1F6B0P7_9BACT|nr:MAG: hypothetical protein A2973_04715 [Candidatus Gottesmanbacteria bacterium RIFCSPLOWO2_01_FULL_49_10]